MTGSRGTTGTPGDVWLPLPPDDIDGLPEGPTYRFWDGGPDGTADFPGDPADCRVFVVPYMKHPDVRNRPLGQMTRLEVVQTLTAGVDDVLAHRELIRPGVRVCNARGVHEASTSELALALILGSLRGIPDFAVDQQRERWRGGGFHPALADRTVLIVGYGAIGSAVEDRLVPFEVARVARVARSARTTPRGPVHPLSELPRLLPDADVVVLTTPLNESSHGLVNADFLARMKDGALLVNVARGKVVDTKALLTELERGRITAALDVTDPEPLPPGHPLWHAPGVLVSPHTGGATSAFLPRAHRLLVSQLSLWLAGEPLDNEVLVTGD